MERKETWFKSSRGMEMWNYCITNRGARLVASVRPSCTELQNSNCVVNFLEGHHGRSEKLQFSCGDICVKVTGTGSSSTQRLGACWGRGNTASREIIPRKSNCFEGLCEHMVWWSSQCSGNGGALSEVVQQRIQKMKLLQDGLLSWIINWLKGKKQRITWVW